MKIKVLILFYSMYGHTYELAKAAAEGAQEVADSEVKLMRVPETLSLDLLRRLNAEDFQKSIQHIPVAGPDDLKEPDAIIFGTPIRYGNMISQMREFLDAIGPLGTTGALIGKIGSVFTCSSPQPQSRESTLFSFYHTLMRHGLILVGPPSLFMEDLLEIKPDAGSPYGVSKLAGPEGIYMPSEMEKAGAHYQGRYVAGIACRFKWGGEDMLSAYRQLEVHPPLTSPLLCSR